MAIRIDPIVAKTSTGLFSAVNNANLPQDQVRQLEQFSWAVQKNKELTQLPIETARSRFNELDPSVQEQLKYLYPKAEYQLSAPDASDYLIGGVKTGLKVAGAPLIYFFKAAGAWNRIINLPYLMARQAQQGEGFFNKQTFTDAWDGRRVFNQSTLDEVVTQYGFEDTEVAKALIAGKKPGEIIASLGSTPNQAILASIEKAFNNPEEFQKVIDAVKSAQVSPGRDFARATGLKRLSGAIDFTYQIAVDPLTWATGGVSALAKFGARVPGIGAERALKLSMQSGTEMVNRVRQYGSQGVRDVFDNNAGVRKLWDDQLGPALEKHAAAVGTAEKATTRQFIKDNFPGYADDEIIDKFTKAGLFNSEKAKNYFVAGSNALDLIAGKTTGMQYFRNAIPTARNQRILAKGLFRKIDDFLNPSTATPEEIDKVIGPDVVDSLVQTGNLGENLLLDAKLKTLEEFRPLTFLEKGKDWLSRGTVRSAQGRQIKLGKDSVKTQSIFNDMARQVMPKDVANWLSEKFVELSGNVAQQLAIVKAVHYATMQRFGLDGTPAGVAFMQEEMRKFGSEISIAFGGKIDIKPGLEDAMSSTGVTQLGNNLSLEANHAIHPSQLTLAVSAPDYRAISEKAAEIKGAKFSVIGQLTRGATSQRSAKLVNAWSLFTLFPRLGVRSAIDETFFYYLTAAPKDLLNYIGGRGALYGKIAAAATGSAAGEGVRARFLNKLGVKSASQLISPERRNQIAAELSENLKGISQRDLSNEIKKAQIKEAIQLVQSGWYPQQLDRIYSFFGGKYKLNQDEEKWFIDALVNTSQYLTSSTRSLGAAASITGRVGQEKSEMMLDNNQLERAMNDASRTLGVEIKQAVKGKVLSKEEIQRAKDFSDQLPALFHFRNFSTIFYQNAMPLDTGLSTVAPFVPGRISGKSDKEFFNIIDTFFNNNAIQTGQDLYRARLNLMEKVGLKKVDDNLIFGAGGEITAGQKAQIPSMTADITHTIQDEVLLDNFLSQFVDAESMIARGISKQETAATLINRMLIDARNTFHGSFDAYNSKLVEKIKSLRTLENGDVIPWRNAVRKLTFDDFFDATKGYRPTGEQWTDLVIEGVTDDPENLLTKFGNWAYEVMDNQVTGIFRQPAVWIKYMQLRKDYTKMEQKMVADLQTNIIQNIIERGGNVSNRQKQSIYEYSKLNAAKFFAERSTEEAVDTVLKYVDNPNIRSNFAIASRNVGRFYRATEDFWRRMYRLKDVSIRSVYRARLTHLGLSASGSVFQDANGDEYVMMPMDDIIFKTVDRAVRAFTSGEESFKQPMFNDFTFKLSLANPSFAPDSGQPTLSGPIGALSVLAMKFVVGDVFGKKATAEQIDNVLLGNIGDSIDIQRAIIPSSFLKLWETLPKKEQTRQSATAAMQAIAYNAAFATDSEITKYLSPNATEADRYTYLKNIRLAGHNVVVARSLLGLISPVVPTAQESKGVPNYLLDVGITGLRPEYYDILDAVLKKFDGVIQDPYELALATYIGKNPGKLVYTVSRQNKQTQVLIRKTKELQNWALNNEEFIGKYGEAAYIFAPNTGDFNSAVYNWLEASGLVEKKSLEKYYMDVLVSEDKQRYYDIERQEKEELSRTAAPDDRRIIIQAATRNRALLKASNPLLEPALVAGGNEIATEVKRLSTIEEILKDSSFKMDAGSRQRLAILTSRVRQFINFANDANFKQSTNYSENKRQLKSEILDIINQLSASDPVVKEAARSTLKAILDYYSRDTYRING